FQHHFREALDGATVGRNPTLKRVNQLVVFIDHKGSVRRNALNSKWSRYSYHPRILVGLVVQILELRPGRNRRVDLLLTLDAELPPLRVDPLCLIGPAVVGGARYLPFLPALAENRIQLLPERLKLFLELLPDDVDLRVVGNGPQCDAGYPFVHETIPDIACCGARVWLRQRELGLLYSAFRTVRKQVVRIACAHETNPS